MRWVSQSLWLKSACYLGETGWCTHRSGVGLLGRTYYDGKVAELSLLLSESNIPPVESILLIKYLVAQCNNKICLCSCHVLDAIRYSYALNRNGGIIFIPMNFSNTTSYGRIGGQQNARSPWRLFFVTIENVYLGCFGYIFNLGHIWIIMLKIS